MRGKIVLGVVSFITLVSVGLTVLLFNVTPIHFYRQTFTFQMNEPLQKNIDYYVKASAKVLENCTLHIDEVDPTIIATYPAYIMYKGDRYDFQIMIEDREKPSIELKDKNAIVSCFVGQVFKAADLVNVNDDTKTTVYFEKTDTDPTEEITLKKEGNFEYYIIAKDSADNYSTRIRIRFEVGVDSSKPVITGVDNVTVKVGDSFDVMAGVEATDNAEGNITSMIVASPTEINTSKPGQYKITYTVTDLSGNTAIETRTVTVTQTSGQVDVGDGPFLTESEVSQRDGIVQSLLNSELDDFDDRDFLTSLNKYLMSYVQRSTSSSDDSSYSAIVKQRGTRMAMVRAVKVILDARGIENRIVYGKNDDMVWNIVKVDNDYRHLDVYANKVHNNAEYCFLLKTTELEDSYAYDIAAYPSCD